MYIPQYVLIQARNPDDVAKQEERTSFANQLGISIENIESFDIFSQDMDCGYLERFDAILVGGSGEYSVLDDTAIIHRFNDFIGECSALNKPMFASCFGFQALVLALGGEIVKAPSRAEVRTFQLTTLQTAKETTVFSGLPEYFYAQLGHQDQASKIPSSTVNVASSALTENQALYVKGYPVFATQFHPELTSDDNRLRFQRYMHVYGTLFGNEEAERILNSHKPSPEANHLLKVFHSFVLNFPASQELKDAGKVI